MNTENTTSLEPSVQREVLLRYLLDQVDESRNRFRLGLPLQLLGYAALYHDKKMLQEYETVHLPVYSLFERLRAYQRLFAEALLRLQDTPVEETAPSMGDAPPVIEGLSQECVAAALRDGREMLESLDFRFVPVFLILSWIGLQSDRDALQDFEHRCISPKMEPEDRISIGLEILKETWEANPNESNN